MCIVMSYCEGGDLAQFLKHRRGVPMSEAEILYHFVQMALALLFMHDKNILHRDLKTQNIFMRKGLVQLGDFGISKQLTGSTDLAQTCIGTPYVSGHCMGDASKVCSVVRPCRSSGCRGSR
jgi:NIMA (never in mitosis gene a)-related kinase